MNPTTTSTWNSGKLSAEDGDPEEEDYEQIYFYYEHCRMETLANYLRQQQQQQQEQQPQYLITEPGSSFDGSYAASMVDSSEKIDDEHADVDEHRDSLSFYQEDVGHEKSKLKLFFKHLRPNYTGPRRSSTSGSIGQDLQSILKKFHCLKCVNSVVDVNHNPTKQIDYDQQYSKTSTNTKKDKNLFRRMVKSNEKPLTNSNDVVNGQDIEKTVLATNPVIRIEDYSSQNNIEDSKTSDQQQQVLVESIPVLLSCSTPPESSTESISIIETLRSKIDSNQSVIAPNTPILPARLFLLEQTNSLANFYVQYTPGFENLAEYSSKPSSGSGSDDRSEESLNHYRSISDCNLKNQYRFQARQNLHHPPSTPISSKNSSSLISLDLEEKEKQEVKMLANNRQTPQQNAHFESNSNQPQPQQSSTRTTTIMGIGREGQPSYVNISRVNHGYVPYNRYTSEFRRDETLLLYNDETDRYSSLPSDSSKGFLHRKIQSLYGETFADDWEHRKKTVKKGQSSLDRQTETGTGTVSSDPIQTTLAGSKLFQKIKSVDNSDHEHLKSTTPTTDDKDWWLREHQATNNNNGNHCSQDDGRTFLKKLQEKRSRLQNKIQQAEMWLQNTSTIPEDCLGKIWAAIGKANLLLDKKFRQFQKLCEDSINQTENEEFKIQNDDLQGFWDMMMIQINDVEQTFQQLVLLKQNQWKPTRSMLEQQPPPQIVNHSPNRMMMHSKSGKNSSRDSSPNNHKTAHNNNNHNHNHTTNSSPRDEQRQRRLLEIKRRGKLNKTETMDQQEIKIFAPNLNSSST